MDPPRRREPQDPLSPASSGTPRATPQCPRTPRCRNATAARQPTAVNSVPRFQPYDLSYPKRPVRYAAPRTFVDLTRQSARSCKDYYFFAGTAGLVDGLVV